MRAGGLTLSPQDLSGVVAQLKPLGYSAAPEGETLVISAEDGR